MPPKKHVITASLLGQPFSSRDLRKLTEFTTLDQLDPNEKIAVDFETSTIEVYMFAYMLLLC